MQDGEQKLLPLARYNELLRAEKILNALYAGGVDNWEWYGESLSGVDDE